MTQPHDSVTRADDILPVGAEMATFGGVELRKGTIAAFIANAKDLERGDVGTDERRELTAALLDAVPKIRAVGLLDVFEPRSARLRDVIDRADASE